MKFYLLLLLSISTLALGACNFSLAEDITPPPGYIAPTPAPTSGLAYPSVPPSPARGASIYATQCEFCHGETGLGNGSQAASLPVPVVAIGLSDISRQSTPSEWYNVISLGRMDRDMPPFPSLSEQERWDVLSFVYMLSTSSEEVASGETLFTQNCTECHGADGLGGSGPTLSDQKFMSQSTAIGLYQTILNGIPPEMPAFTGLGESNIWSLAAYLRFLTFDLTALTPAPTPKSATETPAAASTEIIPAGTGEATPGIDLSPTPEVTGGIITGLATNGSGGGLPQELTVSLLGYDMDASGSYQQVLEMESPVNPDGTYSFTNIEMPIDRAFLVILTYEGIEYQSQPVIVDTAGASLDLPVTLYETSTDTSSLAIDRVHVFLDFSQSDIVQVIELFVLSNSSNYAVVANDAGQPVTNFYVPPDAVNLQFQDGALGDRYIQTENGFGDTAYVIPGSGVQQVLFAFDLLYTNKLDLDLPVNFPTTAILIMVPEGVKAKSDRLTDMGLQDVQGSAIQMYSTENLAAGETLSMTISGMPKENTTSSSGLDSKNNLVIGLAGFGIILISAGAYFFFRERSLSGKNGDADIVDEEDNLNDETSIMDAIIALDEQHKTGTINDDTYQARRTELKARLKDLI